MGVASDFLDLCLDIISGVTVCNFKDDVLLVQMNCSNEILVWLYIMPYRLPKLKQISQNGYSTASTKTACVHEGLTVGEFK